MSLAEQSLIGQLRDGASSEERRALEAEQETVLQHKRSGISILASILH